jgi:hypothetical protein
VWKYRLTDKRAIGFLPLIVLTPAAADALFEKLKINPKGGERFRTAVLAMRVCSRAWKVARRAEPRRVPSDNPFEKMGLNQQKHVEVSLLFCNKGGFDGACSHQNPRHGRQDRSAGPASACRRCC